MADACRFVRDAGLGVAFAFARHLAGGAAEGAAISVIDLATGKIRTWQTLEMPPARAGTSVTPHEVSWLADGRTLAVSYVWPTSESGPIAEAPGEMLTRVIGGVLG